MKEVTRNMKYDSIIIGFGKGGKTLAGFLASKGEKIALIEKSPKMYGGTCINIACLPSKNLVKNSDKVSKMDLSYEEKNIKFKESIKEKSEMVSMLNKKNYNKLASLDNVDVIDGFGSFVDRNTVKVETKDGDIEILGEKIFINTGAKTSFPKLEGIKDNKFVYDSEGIMELEELPKKLTIIGASYISIEFASIFSGFGSEVVVLDRRDEFLKREDRDIAQEIKSQLENRGVSIYQNASTTKIENDKVFYKQDGKEKYIEDTIILLATGRKPNIEKLNLEAAGVEIAESGLIKVDKHLKTTAENIWAIGDVCERQQFTYISLDDYRIIKSTLAGDGSYNLEERKNVPYSMYVTPTFSRVGLSEEEAKKNGINYKIKTMKTAEIPMAHVIGKPEGMLKALVDENSNKILGVMLLCENAHELINIVKLAMDMDADYTVLRDNIYTHPTMAESFNDLFNL